MTDSGATVVDLPRGPGRPLGGGKPAGSGRKKGTPNRITKAARDVFHPVARKMTRKMAKLWTKSWRGATRPTSTSW